MKTATVAAILIVTLTLPVAAYAQGVGRGLERKKEEPVNPEKKKAEDKAYNDALTRIPSKEFDPWGSMRENTPAAKPSTPQKKPSR